MESIGSGGGCYLRREDYRHDDTVNGDDLAEDDGDEILRSYAWGFDAASEDRYAGYEDAPGDDQRRASRRKWNVSYHAAPTTDNPMQRPIPIFAQVYGDTVSRNWPT